MKALAKAPKPGTRCYVPSLTAANKFFMFVWDGSEAQLVWLTRNIVFLNSEDASGFVDKVTERGS